MDDIPISIDPKSTRFIPRLRLLIRQKGLAYSTEKTYIMWLHSFYGFIAGKNPDDLVVADVFVYRHVLDKHIGDNELNAVRAVYKRRLPVVLTAKEVHSIFDKLSGINRLMAMLIYGCGLRLQECLTLRIKDVDTENRYIHSATVLQLTYSKTVMTLEQFRNF